MAKKHFNRGTVWGRVQSLEYKKNQNNTPYLWMKIKAGNALVYGKLWGEIKALNALVALHKHYPKSLYKFTGFLEQYEKKNKLYSLFSFYDWEQISEAQERAVFILIGFFLGTDKGKGWVEVEREYNGRPQKAEFELVLPTSSVTQELSPGTMVKVKGELAREEDYYGDTTGKIEPWVKALEVLK